MQAGLTGLPLCVLQGAWWTAAGVPVGQETWLGSSLSSRLRACMVWAPHPNPPASPGPSCPSHQASSHRGGAPIRTGTPRSVPQLDISAQRTQDRLLQGLPPTLPAPRQGSARGPGGPPRPEPHRPSLWAIQGLSPPQEGRGSACWGLTVSREAPRGHWGCGRERSRPQLCQSKGGLFTALRSALGTGTGTMTGAVSHPLPLPATVPGAALPHASDGETGPEGGGRCQMPPPGRGGPGRVDVQTGHRHQDAELPRCPVALQPGQVCAAPSRAASP